MFNLKALAVTALVAATSVVAAPGAEANTCFNSSVTGGVICNTYQGSNRYGDVYTLGYSIGYTSESMTVVCRGAQVIDWKSSGSMSQRGAQRLANHFCSI